MNALKKLKIFVSVSSDISTDNRVLKACTLIHEMGYNVELFGRKKSNSISLPEKKFKIIRIRMLFQKGPFFYAMLNTRLFFILLFKKIDGLYANDLDTLLPMYIISRIKKVPLVYDTHEIFTEVPELIKRPFKQKIWLFVERKVFKNLKTIITVNESIAEHYEKVYSKKIHVIRNISPIKNIDKKFDGEKEKWDKTKKFRIIIQGSGLNIERGIEESVLAMRFIENAKLIIVGDGDALPKVQQIIRENGLKNKVELIGRLPYQEMMKYTRSAQLGLSLDKPSSLNYKFSLPNKIFDYIHAETPILASNLIEISRIINQYRCGIIINQICPESIAKEINNLMDNVEKYERIQKNCKDASKELSWHKESIKLKRIISEAYSTDVIN